MSARVDATELSETCALLEWMENRHFTFLGYREYRLKGGKGRERLEPVKSSGLGILRPGHRKPESTTRVLHSDIRRQSRSRNLSLVTKANSLSTVHRAGYLDYVGIKQFDAKGRLIGERRFLGLWTSAAYNSNPREIPLLRQKIAQVTEHFALAPDSHDGKALQHVLESFPRDELFQASVAELNRIVTGIFGLQERPRVRVLVAPRSVSPLLFVPGVRAAREIQHAGSPANRAGDTRSVFRVQHGISSANRGVESCAHPHRRANRSRPKARTSMRTCWSGASRRPCARGWILSRLRCWRASTRPMPCSCSTSMRRPFPRPTPRTSRRSRGLGCVLSRSDGQGTARACTWISTGRIRSAKKNFS